MHCWFFSHVSNTKKTSGCCCVSTAPIIPPRVTPSLSLPPQCDQFKTEMASSASWTTGWIRAAPRVNPTAIVSTVSCLRRGPAMCRRRHFALFDYDAIDNAYAVCVGVRPICWDARCVRVCVTRLQSCRGLSLFVSGEANAWCGREWKWKNIIFTSTGFNQIKPVMGSVIQQTI